MQKVDVVLIFYQFVNGVDLVVVKVVDVVNVVFVVMQFQKDVDDFQDVFFVQCLDGVFGIYIEMYIYFYMFNCGQIVVFCVKEQ